jgi:hypothetical protein
MKDYLEVAADFTGANIAYIDSDDNIITTGTEFSVGNTIQFQVGETPATFQAGALPGTITMTNYMQFTIASKTVNGTGWDYELNYIGLSVNFLTAGTVASHTVALADTNLYIFWDNDGYKNVSIKGLVKSLIKKTGYSVDTSPMDVVPVTYNSGSDIYWNYIVHDLNQLYAVDKNYAADLDQLNLIDDTYLSCFDILSQCQSMMGFVIEYYSENTFRIVPGQRTLQEIGVPPLYFYILDSDPYTINDNNNYSPKEYRIPIENGAIENGLGFPYERINTNSCSVRSKYYGNTEEALDIEINSSESWSNWNWCLRLVGSGTISFVDSYVDSAYLAFLGTHRYRAKLYEWDVEEIETSWTDTIKTVKENSYNLRTGCSKIIQETIVT